MVETVFGVICASYLIRTSSIWQLYFIPFVEQMEYRDHLIVFEGVLFWRELRLMTVEAALLGLRLHVPRQFHRHSLFPFGLRRLW